MKREELTGKETRTISGKEDIRKQIEDDEAEEDRLEMEREAMEQYEKEIIKVSIKNDTVTTNGESCNFYQAGLYEVVGDNECKNITDHDVIEEHLIERERYHTGKKVVVVFTDEEEPEEEKIITVCLSCNRAYTQKQYDEIYTNRVFDIYGHLKFREATYKWICWCGNELAEDYDNSEVENHIKRLSDKLTNMINNDSDGDITCTAYEFECDPEGTVEKWFKRKRRMPEIVKNFKTFDELAKVAQKVAIETAKIFVDLFSISEGFGDEHLKNNLYKDDGSLAGITVKQREAWYK